MPEVLPDETLDILCNDKIRLVQKRKGYRFSIDPVLLAGFVRLKTHETVLDVGTGCGIIPIWMIKKGYANPFVGIEIQDELYGLAVKNKDLNQCSNITFLHGDVRTAKKDLGNFHVVIANPPFMKERGGRRCPGVSRNTARSESSLELSALITFASSVLFTRGRFYLIYPTKRLAELIYTAKSEHLEPKRLRLIHSRAGEPSKLSLLECVKGAGTDLKVEPPLYIHHNGQYTEEVRAYYA
jgi:tRNA1Val (adenine37-N6)-methyltransferase